ncbi:MAG: SHOCT domain-containing protein [Clostridia bacterium]|nr:SHOCT domain-containing protein [Clostridia bacterium]
MMKKLLTLLLALCLCCACALAEDLYAVGGSTLEEAVQMIPGYQVTTSDDGAKMITVTDLATEYYVLNSENGTAIIPNMVSVMNFQMHVPAFMFPTEFDKVTKFVVTTDSSIHTVTNAEPWDCAGDEVVATAMMANAQLEAVLFDMGKSENVRIEYFQDNSTSKAYDLTDEQKFLLRQYVYTCETFLPKPPADATTTLVMALLSSQFTYTVATVPNPDAQPAGAINANTGSASLTEQLQELKDLLDAGLITQEDYDAKKAQILGL